MVPIFVVRSKSEIMTKEVVDMQKRVLGQPLKTLFIKIRLERLKTKM